MMKTLKLLSGEMTPSTQTRAKIYLPAPTFPVQMAGAPLLTRTLCADVTTVSWPPRSGGVLQNGRSASTPQTTEAALIYVVDDEEALPELYTLLLEGKGHSVRAFHHRAEALAALTTDRNKPDLLITDYCGLSMPVEWFMRQCLMIHPALRILMASGLSQTFVRFSSAQPDRFIQKPFTADEFLNEVRAALTARRLFPHMPQTLAPVGGRYAHQSNKGVHQR
jgi:CheY-like chemotaxis protein